MTFNIAQFSKDTKDSNSSLVKEYELNESRRPSMEDVIAARADTYTVAILTAGITGPALIIMWQYLPISLTTIVMITVMIVATIGLIRYEKIATMSNTSDGRVNWEHLKHEAVSKGKAEIRYIREDTHHMTINDEPITYQHLNHILKSDVVTAEQLTAIAQAVLTNGKFNQDTICKAGNLATSKYSDFANEMINQGLLTMKGKTLQQGVALNKRGYELFSHLLPTPLLASTATKSAENQGT